jgi:hypothetical protein
MKFNSALFPLTIVIPTLGGDSLFKTIELINSGTIVPEEILVCIPKEEAYRVLNHNLENVKVIATNCKGQVQQRAEGFKEAKHIYVMQVDDDIELGLDVIEKMLILLKELGQKNVIGPSYYSIASGDTLHKFNVGVKGFLKTLNAFVFSASLWGESRMGKVTSIGVAYGIDPDFFKGKETVKVSWLPGGCVLGLREDLIMNNFFPLSGKAFSEDVIHSNLRTLNNIQHHVSLSSIVKTEVDEDVFSWEQFKSEFRVKNHIVKLICGSRLRLMVWGIEQFLIRRFRLKK